jgi:hypothetical protein
MVVAPEFTTPGEVSNDARDRRPQRREWQWLLAIPNRYPELFPVGRPCRSRRRRSETEASSQTGSSTRKSRKRNISTTATSPIRSCRRSRGTRAHYATIIVLALV